MSIFLKLPALVVATLGYIHVYQSVNQEWGCTTPITTDSISNLEHSWWLIHWHSQAVVCA
jgi:hypothetical protein